MLMLMSLLIFCGLITAAKEIGHYLKKEHVTYVHRILFLIFCLYVVMLVIVESRIETAGMGAPFLGRAVGITALYIPMGLLPVFLFGQCKSPKTTLLWGWGTALGLMLILLFCGRGFFAARLLCAMAGIALGFGTARLMIQLIPSMGLAIGVMKIKHGRCLYKIKDALGYKAMLMGALVLLAVFEVVGDFSWSFDFCFGKTIEVEIEGKNACVMEAGSGRLLFQKEADAQIAPASTTKMLTALTALDVCALDEAVCVGEEIFRIGAESSRAWLNVGDELTVRQLLVAMLLPSGNDAAYTMAVFAGRKMAGEDQSIDEALDTFVSAMNDKARAVGAKSSAFKSPDGYDTQGQYTTARDLARIALECLKSPELAQIMGSSRISDQWLNGREVTYDNTNELLNPDSGYYYEKAIGMKTGGSDLAGYCLVAAAKIHGETYICVVMGDSPGGRWIDARALFKALE